MPSSSSARMTRTAISPRLATRTFANMRREDYLVATATSRSVADRAAAVGAGALEHDGVDGGAAPPPDPPPGGRRCAKRGRENFAQVLSQACVEARAPQPPNPPRAQEPFSTDQAGVPREAGGGAGLAG